MKSMSWPSFALTPLLAALTLASLDVLAAGPVAPTDSGSLLQELKPPLNPTPRPQGPNLTIEARNRAALLSAPPFLVKTIRITGNTAFDTATLHALVADQEGKSLTLAQLEELASRITQHYQAQGFPLARAIIPAQTVADGAVTMQVVEARYGKIQLKNSSPVSNSMLDATLSALKKGQPVSENELDRALLLLSDIPEVDVNAVLKPGEEVGTSDLQVDTAQKPSKAGVISIDNYGNRYVGRARLSFAGALLNPFHHGDTLSANLVTAGERMSYGSVAYDTLLNGQGTHAGGAYSMVHYKLGGSVTALDAHGTAGVASLWVRHPFLRGKQTNLYGQIQYDAKKLEDRVDASNTRTDRHLGNWVLNLNGEMRDSTLGGGISVWALGWTQGRVRFDDVGAELADAATAKTRGRFSKVNLSLSRLQGLSSRDVLYVSLAGQWSDANLDSAEKMSIGGPTSVRAYDIGAISGDTGYVGTVELRHDLGEIAGGAMQAIAFIDSARVNVNRHSWATGENSATLSGAGIGVRWSPSALWDASAFVASRVGSVSPLLGSSAATRGWLVVGRAF